MTRIRDIVKLGRPKFLVYSPMLYTLGAAIACASGTELALGPYVAGLLFVWCTHLMTHYCNEYYDLPSDRENQAPSPWTGGSRVLVRGAVRPALSLALARVLLGVAVLIAGWLPGAHAKLLAVIAVVFAWEYTAPPLRMCTRGLGELGVTLVLNTLVPLLGLVLQGGSALGSPLVLLLVPLAIIEYVRMMVMNMADREADRRGGKLTLIVRIGMPRAVRIHAAGMVLAYAGLLPLHLAGVPLLPLLLLSLTAPLGAWQAVRLLRSWRSATAIHDTPFWASTHNGLAAASVLLGVLLLRGASGLFGILALPLLLYALSLAGAARRWLRQRDGGAARRRR
jgi:1,4-dihydroxy-2-naphthoate polyprenyltransferase